VFDILPTATDYTHDSEEAQGFDIIGRKKDINVKFYEVDQQCLDASSEEQVENEEQLENRLIQEISEKGDENKERDLA
jgi:hypothetical protein